MNKLKIYEAPSTRVAKVELRTNLLAGSIMQEESKSVEAKGHEVGEVYEFGDDNAGTASGGDFKVEWD